MTKNIAIESRLLFSKQFPTSLDHVKFSHYTLKVIPTDSLFDGEAVLSFSDKYEHEQGNGSNPEEEILNVLRIISVLLNTRIKKTGLRVNSIHIQPGKSRNAYKEFLGILDLKDIQEYFDQVLKLDEDIARQLLRSCHSYSFAIEFIPSDITFAFFLLVVAIECLSSQNLIIPHEELDMDRKKCERFSSFIKKYFPHERRGDDETNDELFTELLKTVYYSHRSGFVHGGKEVSIAATLADQAKSSYFKHNVKGRVTKTPGIGWFANIVRYSIIGFIKSFPLKGNPVNEFLLSKLSFEKAGIQMKVKRAVRKGEPVKIDDIDFR